MKKIALVTGGSRGIGRAVCLGLARDGFDIWLNYLTAQAAAEEVKTLVEAQGRECVLVPFNVADGAESSAALAPLLKTATPYALVNNAGFAKDGMFGLMPAADWQNVIDVALGGFYNVTHAVVPQMIRARQGRIISISSISGQAGNAGQVNYSAAKAGLIGASKALSKELGRRGITVNVVAPGIINTEMAAQIPEERKKHIIDAIPLARMGEPEDVAGCVRFLCSDLAAYISGQAIGVNGGLYA